MKTYKYGERTNERWYNECRGGEHTKPVWEKVEKEAASALDRTYLTF